MSGAPWPAATATGVGSLPGTDPTAALRLVLDEVPELPFLPELPARGPWSDLVGRAGAVLADLPVELQPAGWRLAARPGRDLARARDHLAADLDVAAALLSGYAGPLKVAVCGPWTLAAAVETPRRGAALRDPGAVRDLAAALAEGLAALLSRLADAVPGARPVVQLDEPTLPAVLAGRLTSASGFAALPVPDDDIARDRLAAVLAAAGPAAGVHCCAADPAAVLELARAAGAGWAGLDVLALDGAGPDSPGEEALGAALEAGLGLLAGLVPATDAELPRPDAAAGPLLRLWRRLGLPPGPLARQVAVSPTCGLAGASPDHARRALRSARAVAEVLAEEAA